MVFIDLKISIAITTFITRDKKLLKIKQKNYLPLLITASASKNKLPLRPRKVLSKFWYISTALAKWESATPSHPHPK